MKLHAHIEKALFVVSDDNDEIILNYKVEDEELIVDVTKLFEAITKLLEGKHHD